jgi:hypothetical protein
MKNYPTIEETRQHHAKRLRGTEQGMGGKTPMEFLPSNMAAGPCSAALKAAKKRHDTGTKYLPPLDDCTHPDQCACMFRIDSDRLKF